MITNAHLTTRMNRLARLLTRAHGLLSVHIATPGAWSLKHWERVTRLDRMERRIGVQMQECWRLARVMP